MKKLLFSLALLSAVTQTHTMMRQGLTRLAQTARVARMTSNLSSNLVSNREIVAINKKTNMGLNVVNSLVGFAMGYVVFVCSSASILDSLEKIELERFDQSRRLCETRELWRLRKYDRLKGSKISITPSFYEFNDLFLS